MNATNEASKHLLSSQAVHPHSRGDTWGGGRCDIVTTWCGHNQAEAFGSFVFSGVTVFPASSLQ